MNMVLNEKFERYVKSKVANGDHSNSIDVVEEALQLLQEKDEKIKVLRNEIQKGIDNIEAGRYTAKTMS